MEDFEEDAGAAGLEVADGYGVDDLREVHLEVDAVADGVEVEGVGARGGAHSAVAADEALVEVAVGLAAERGRAAGYAVEFDVLAGWAGHPFSFCLSCKFPDCRYLAKFDG